MKVWKNENVWNNVNRWRANVMETDKRWRSLKSETRTEAGRELDSQIKRRGSIKSADQRSHNRKSANQSNSIHCLHLVRFYPVCSLILKELR